METNLISDNRVYYGEYTLKHWLELILSKNITLPDFQRCYCWDKKAAENFIISISNDDFIPPVTIGYLKEKKENLIIDGQQRLTTLLLASLNKFPIASRFKPDANDNVRYVDENDNDSNDNVIQGWTFNKLIEIGCTRKNIIEYIDKNEDSNYSKFDIDEINIDKIVSNVVQIMASRFNKLYDNSIFKIWAPKQYKSFLNFVSKISDNDLIVKKQDGTYYFFADKQKDNNNILLIIYNKLYRKRNKCAHNVGCYLENLPDFETLKEEQFIYQNWFVYFFILCLIDELYIRLFNRYRELRNGTII